MPWMVVYVSLAVAGLAVLAGPALRVFREVRRLTRELRAGSEAIARGAADLESAVRPLAGAPPAGRG